jgi:hypothetical protein
MMVARETCKCELANGMVTIEGCDVYGCHGAQRGERLQVTFTHAQTQTRLRCCFDKEEGAQLLLVSTSTVRRTGRYKRGAGWSRGSALLAWI